MNLLGIDFEEWFHPELIQKNIKINDKKLSVVNGIDKILNLLSKSINPKGTEKIYSMSI